MKTTSTLKRLLAAALILLSIGTANARPIIGLHDIYMNSVISGDGFGVRYTPSLGIRLGNRVVLSGGPLFGMPGWQNMGYQLSTHYFVMNERDSYSEHGRMSIFFSAERFTNQDLGPQAVENEKMAALNMNNDEKTDFSALRYKGWECAAGFALSYHFNFGLLLRSECSLAYYDTQQINMQNVNTLRDHNSLGLRLGAGIGWALCK